MLRKLATYIKSKLSAPHIEKGNKDKVSSIGTNSVIHSYIDKRAVNSRIDIGSECLIEGGLVTETDESRIQIGDNVFVGGGSIIDCVVSVIIENDVLISRRLHVVILSIVRVSTVRRVFGTTNFCEQIEICGIEVGRSRYIELASKTSSEMNFSGCAYSNTTRYIVISTTCVSRIAEVSISAIDLGYVDVLKTNRIERCISIFRAVVVKSAFEVSSVIGISRVVDIYVTNVKKTS